MARTLLVSLPGLSRELIAHIPKKSGLDQLLARSTVSDFRPPWPAVTCSVQASFTTGQDPSRHGIIANGIPSYLSPADADLTDPANMVEYRCQVSFWEQSNQLLDVPRVWSGQGLKTALLFFQQSIPGFSGPPCPAADIVLTPKPEHGEGGKLTSLLWSSPPSLAGELQRDLGPFPLMNYWGPMAGLKSSDWIARAATTIWTEHHPDLQLTYVPHLDYDLQRFGPRSPQAAKAVADLATALEPLLAAAANDRVIILSEYAIDEVTHALAPNRALLDAGMLKLRPTNEGPRIDYLESAAWALCDHQIGHVYLRGADDYPRAAKALLAAGIEVLWPSPIDHRRAGNLQIQSPANAWLDYRWWANPADAPPWATTVDIHRKPGYDPLELFLEPGTRQITADAGKIKGSHGRTDATPGIFVAPGNSLAQVTAADVAKLLIQN